jgi:asparaginyl-tRNA synthetase
MTYCYIEKIGEYVGKEASIRGWLYNKRSSGKVHFLLIRDGTGILQCVMGIKDVPEEIFHLADELPQESSLIVSGIVREDKRAPGGYELLIKDMKIVHISEPYPIALKEHGIDFLMEHRHLWLRSRKQHALLRIRHYVISAVRDFLNNNGFLCVDTPIFTPAACEGTTTLFEVKYFDDVAYLTQSGQLYNEANCMAFGKVYCFGPTFRAEKSKTRRHLTEFWMVEPEVAWATLDDIMILAEDLVVYVVERVLASCKRELEVLERDVAPLEKVKKPFPRISYTDAVKFLKEKGSDIEWGDDFGAPDETLLSKNYDKPVMVHRYPAKCKAFYMEPDPENNELVLCVDCLAPEGYGEIIGGSQRIHDKELLIQKIKENNLPMEAFQWYIDLRRYGSVPHSGFGMGIERVVAWLGGIEHIRETIPYPRMLYRIYP